MAAGLSILGLAMTVAFLWLTLRIDDLEARIAALEAKAQEGAPKP
jgi:hypothetical protein